MSLVVCSLISVCCYTISSSFSGVKILSYYILSGDTWATGRLWWLKACSALVLLYVQCDSITSRQLWLSENSSRKHWGRFKIQFLGALKQRCAHTTYGLFNISGSAPWVTWHSFCFKNKHNRWHYYSTWLGSSRCLSKVAFQRLNAHIFPSLLK